MGISQQTSRNGQKASHSQARYAKITQSKKKKESQVSGLEKAGVYVRQVRASAPASLFFISALSSIAVCRCLSQYNLFPHLAHKIMPISSGQVPFGMW